jgi:hypothetical protein
MVLSIGFLVSRTWRLSSCAVLLLSICLVVWRVGTVKIKSLRSRATGSTDTPAKSGTSISTLILPHSIRTGIGRTKGRSTTAAAILLTPCIAVMLLGSLAIPGEHAMVVNQIKTTGRLYLPHVSQEMDQYHFYADPDGDATKRMLLTFCSDKGFKPPWDEGHTISWMRYKQWPQCLELLGMAVERDKSGKIIER